MVEQTRRRNYSATPSPAPSRGGTRTRAQGRSRPQTVQQSIAEADESSLADETNVTRQSSELEEDDDRNSQRSTRQLSELEEDDDQNSRRSSRHSSRRAHSQLPESDNEIPTPRAVTLLSGKVVAFGQPGAQSSSAYGSRSALLDSRTDKSYFHEVGAASSGTPSNRAEVSRSEDADTGINAANLPSTSSNGASNLRSIKQWLRSVQNFFVAEIPLILIILRWLFALVVAVSFLALLMASAVFLFPGLPRLFSPVSGILGPAVLPSPNLPECIKHIEAAEAEVQRQFEVYHNRQDTFDKFLEDLNKKLQRCVSESVPKAELESIMDSAKGATRQLDVFKGLGTEMSALRARLTQLEYTVHTYTKDPRHFDLNFWSPYLGVTIDPRYTSPTFPGQVSFLKRALSNLPVLSAASHYPPLEAVKPWSDAGQCWCGRTDANGHVSIALDTPAAVVAAYFAVEHLPRAHELDEDAAPKTFELWVLTDGPARADYDDVGCDYKNRPHPDMHCVLRKDLPRASHHAAWSLAIPGMDLEYGFRKAIVRVTKNAGGSGATCLYRLLLGGELRGEEVPAEEKFEKVMHSFGGTKKLII